VSGNDLVLAALAEPVMITDAQGAVIYANPAGMRRFGWDKVTGIPLAERVARWPMCRRDRTPVAANEDPVAIVLATGRPVLDFRFTVATAAGQWEWFTMNTSPLVEAGQLAGTASVVHDITPAMRLEADLADHAARLEAVVDQSFDAVFVVDRDGRILFTNAVAQRLLEPGPAETAAERARRLDPRALDGTPIGADGMPSSLALAGTPVSDMALTIGTPEGRRQMAARAHPLHDADGAIYAAAVTLRDVTDDVRLHAELEEAREGAEEANRLKDEFIAALSHELRTPLQPILGWTEVLRRHGRLDDVTAQALEAIRRNIRQQVRLVDDLLDLSRIVHGKFQLRFESFDLRDHVRSAAEPFEETAALRRVRLTLALPPTPVLMWGDGARVQQIASNLIANAVKFTPPGGQIGVHLTTRDNEALLEVEDTGDGIAPEDLAVIFEAFRQGGSSRRRGGLGIGLDLVKRLTELHGGSVEAFSEGPGYGARFHVRLPLATPPTPRPRRAESTTRLDGRTILVVEDNADTRQVLKFMLEIEGAHVEAVESGAEAVARAETFRPQIVLCDIGLPDIDGLEVARRMRGRSWFGETRLIALTGYGQPEDIRTALEAGFEAHLTKPINLDQLLALLGVHDAA
jgi:signal transduction histidine kinase/ActR/RegA family two-component response regulator